MLVYKIEKEVTTSVIEKFRLRIYPKPAPNEKLQHNLDNSSTEILRPKSQDQCSNPQSKYEYYLGEDEEDGNYESCDGNLTLNIFLVLFPS